MGDQSRQPATVPPQVHCELKTLHQMRTHDMGTAEVVEGLEKYDFTAALEWVLENPELYIRTVQGQT